MAYRVFLSHSGADSQLAKWIAGCSGPNGIEVYLFERNPQPGSSVSEKIKHEIQRADAVVVLLTQNSQSSSYVQQEIGYAEGLQKLIVPIVCPSFDQKHLAMLQGREYVPLDYRDPQSALRSLLNFLGERKKEKESTQAILAIGGLLLIAMFGNKG